MKFKPGERSLFKVPNNEEGKEFVRLFRKFFNHRNYSQARKGRHHDRKTLYDKLGKLYTKGRENAVPVDKATYWAIYVDPKDLDREFDPIYHGDPVELRKKLTEARMRGGIWKVEAKAKQSQIKLLERKLCKHLAIDF